MAIDKRSFFIMINQLSVVSGQWLLPSLQGGVGVGLPIALGVIRNVEEESYDMAVNEQINEVREKSKVKTFDQLTQTLEQWEVNR